MSQVPMSDELTEQMVVRPNLGLVFGAFVAGVGVGGAAGYFLTRYKLETKYNKIAEDEITVMREHYRMKETALENTTGKPDLGDLVREQGYSQDPPMAVTPPSSVVEATETPKDKEAPKPQEEPEVKNIFEMNQIEDHWDYREELIHRSPIKPYVIHRDERDESDTYDVVSYTYYEADDVLSNEREEVIGKPERDILLGEQNLGKFGHGSGDPSVVYIRNDKLEMEMEVVRSPNSYAEEVHGFQHSESLSKRHRRDRSFSDDE